MPMYNFDPAEEQDDLLEQELLDHGRDGSLAGPNNKVRITTEAACFLPDSDQKDSVSHVIKIIFSEELRLLTYIYNILLSLFFTCTYSILFFSMSSFDSGMMVKYKHGKVSPVCSCTTFSPQQSPVFTHKTVFIVLTTPCFNI